MCTCKQLKPTLKYGWIVSQGSQLWHPWVLSCALSCTASGCCSSGWNIFSPDKSQHCPVPEPQSLSFGVPVSQIRVLTDNSDRFICIDPSYCSPPGSQLSAEVSQYKGWQHWPQSDATSVSVHCVSSKTCKSCFLLQTVNLSSETLAHARSSSKAAISSQQARQTSGTAML